MAIPVHRYLLFILRLFIGSSEDIATVTSSHLVGECRTRVDLIAVIVLGNLCMIDIQAVSSDEPSTDSSDQTNWIKRVSCATSESGDWSCPGEDSAHDRYSCPHHRTRNAIANHACDETSRCSFLQISQVVGLYIRGCSIIGSLGGLNALLLRRVRFTWGNNGITLSGI
jgi:hypothetical protein